VQIVKLEPGVSDAIKSILAAKTSSSQPLRIELRFTGCCDASLGLFVDAINETDIHQEIDGVMFVIRPDIHELVGEVTIARADKNHEQGFVLTSAKPVSEWEGVGICTISA
jgi:Fe-S cluster assembly iron-binding protein IscA